MKGNVTIICVAILLFLFPSSQARNLRILDSEISAAGSKTVLKVEIQNTGPQPLMPIVWLDLYDDHNQHVERLKSQRLEIQPRKSTRYWIELNGLSPGTYSGLVVGQYISHSETENVNDTIMLLGNIKPFTLPFEKHNSVGIVRMAKPQSKPDKPDSFIPAAQKRDRFTGNQSLYKALRARVKKLKMANNHAATLDENAKQRSEKETNNVIQKTKSGSDKSSNSENDEKYQYYVVKSGDWLSKIAKEFYGDESKYAQIFEANRDLIQNPDLIFPGQKLRIPIGEDGHDIGRTNAEE